MIGHVLCCAGCAHSYEVWMETIQENMYADWRPIIDSWLSTLVSHEYWYVCQIICLCIATASETLLDALNVYSPSLVLFLRNLYIYIYIYIYLLGIKRESENKHYIHIYIYIYICVCVCVCVERGRWRVSGTCIEWGWGGGMGDRRKMSLSSKDSESNLTNKNKSRHNIYLKATPSICARSLAVVVQIDMFPIAALTWLTPYKLVLGVR